MEPEEKYALVTGASSGIGLKISEKLALKGFSIIAVSNQPEELDNLRTKLEEIPGTRVVIIEQDLSEPEAPLKVHKRCREQKLRVDILVNNAGILVFDEAARADYSKIEEITRLHVTAPALLCRLFGGEMINRRSGYILNVASLSAVMPFPGISLYGPTKSFLRYYSRALRIEMKRYNVIVSCLMPGATDTSLYRLGRYDRTWARRTGLIKSPESVAEAGLKALFHDRGESVPGFLNKLTFLLVPLIPSAVISYIHRKKRLVGNK
jgi:hypothetical protein